MPQSNDPRLQLPGMSNLPQMSNYSPDSSDDDENKGDEDQSAQSQPAGGAAPAQQEPQTPSGASLGLEQPKLDTPVGPITAPPPEAVAASGGVKGYLRGVIGRLPKALAIVESSYGNSAPLQNILQEERRQDQLAQQQFANTITSQRENRANQMYAQQYQTFKLELQKKQYDIQSAQEKALKEQQERTAREVILNNASSPQAIQRAHQVLQSLGVEKVENNPRFVDAQGREMIYDPRTGISAPMVEMVPGQPPAGFQGPTPPGYQPPMVARPVMGQVPRVPGDDFEHFFQRGVNEGRWQNTSGDEEAAHDLWNKRNQPTAAQTDTRLDKSYQYNQSALEKLAQPVEQRQERMGRLLTTLDQRNPAADALIAPEVLSVMAGGQASGLRMNEAEIERIVGGRNNWVGLKSKLLAWQSDETKPFQLIEPQRTQFWNLAQAIARQDKAKVKIYQDAMDKLIDAPDVQTHRRIRSSAERAVSEYNEQDVTQPNRPPKGAEVVPMH